MKNVFFIFHFLFFVLSIFSLFIILTGRCDDIVIFEFRTQVHGTENRSSREGERLGITRAARTARGLISSARTSYPRAIDTTDASAAHRSTRRVVYPVYQLNSRARPPPRVGSWAETRNYFAQSRQIRLSPSGRD